MICLVAGSIIASLMTDAITVAWTHSIEKIVWEEDWRADPLGLHLVEARVRGSGAGMDPPPEARFDNGVWAWKPTLPPQQRIILRRSGTTADWRVCIAGQCRPMEAYVPADSDPVTLKICELR